ncbi:CPBP family intramembrane glutamic endopeptidase [Lentibacillus daqui]|uniref:CPBP family intramembrane glutamic endopeptidase n=1 Tax=Lentibacillus daqui TaxID=2911514 RepID=UPI0022B1B7EE|nr:type II CAAX endopeptidase family protein [Lentibacillus daqui]
MTRRYWYVILTYIIMQFSAIVFVPLIYFTTSLNKFDISIYWTIFSFIAGLVVTLLLMKPEMKANNNRNAADWGYTIVWVIAGVVMAYVFQAIAVWIETKLLGIQSSSENTNMIINISRMAPLFVIIPALIAPILEEIIFRKIIFGWFYKRMNFFFAALLSALIFAIIHQEPEHLLIYASMGFVLAFVYVQTKRIIAPILVHMTLNSISVIVQLLLSPEDLQKMMEQADKVQMILIIY